MTVNFYIKLLTYDLCRCVFVYKALEDWKIIPVLLVVVAKLGLLKVAESSRSCSVAYDNEVDQTKPVFY